jgi:hypothetical protein
MHLALNYASNQENKILPHVKQERFSSIYQGIDATLVALKFRCSAQIPVQRSNSGAAPTALTMLSKK